MSNLIPIERIENKIYLIRGQKVMLDKDLSDLYQVPTKRLNEQVKRNMKRFPDDFMFQLNKKEVENLRSHFATSRWGGRRYLPLAFTEQGVAMLSTVLSSERAIMVNIVIMRAFVKIKRILSTHVEVSRKLRELESKVDKHDSEIHKIFDAIREMISLPDKPKGKIGFV
ncbi:MAG: ORF6N domain-containing protein [Candidatus Margulisbacteria bacterium]|nr:ORF6N domain-containing protein [Candidatus Margulisiibacteriota bacterium]MBU1021789.1 ORF6N domain-containing protein [Candidatus Margulisiibacteriota bacterium]MBU1729535.1 ORF6N domain-containing protein [Candidatus Margulisiibacteriota bacterium]MBU1955364.1 ORF6N domain-containing protein [Candidatus Margulisiibacteriota bacterium]